jgi:hypothetical protein
MTVTISDPNFARIVAALDREWERAPGETDGAFVKRYGKHTFVELVYRNERGSAAGAILADDALVVIT